MLKFRATLLTLFSCTILAAQEYFPANGEVKTKNNNYTALTNAKIFVSPSQVLEKGTLLIRNGKVVKVGKSVDLPENTVVVEAAGRWIYPSFIDIFSDFGISKPEKAEAEGRSAEYEPSRDGYYWNDHIMPENDAIDKFTYDQKEAEKLLKNGFGVVNSHIQDGIARGTGVLIALNDRENDAVRILNDRSAQYFSFTKSIAQRQSYPTSLMGAMALLRQMYADADWYEKGNVDTKDRSLEALMANKGLVQIFSAEDKGNVLRADGIGDQFGIQYAILAGGDEYERVSEIKATNASLILPLNFPDAYDVEDPYAVHHLSLKSMRHWNQAPANPKILAENEVPFAFTLHGLKTSDDFMTQLQKAIAYGLPKTKALHALTTEPAQILQKSNDLGTLQEGRIANFLISSGDIFDKETVLYENWVQGKKYVVNDIDKKDIRGEYDVTIDNQKFSLSIKGKSVEPKIEVKKDTLKLKAQLKYNEGWLTIAIIDKNNKTYRLSTSNEGISDNQINGKVLFGDGRESTFSAVETAPFSQKDKKENYMPPLTDVTFPNIGYGYEKIPQAQNMLFKNATVWTSEEQGILKNTDVLVKNGKIQKVGSDLNASGATVIDATGKHLTAGIIDEHSHIAALAINEAGQNSSAEVQMQDVVDNEDKGIYHALAGGVTTLQLLHGSANPIGGQSAIMKLKWGMLPNEMVYENSPKFIKFALGENVKQSNWGSYTRFPQTRMGVEQVFMNYFQRAKEYLAKKESGEPYRYDEEMETLGEILRGERFITCHSYVQSEINMMMKVAEKFDFKVNTFTHILEGYKVADKMKEHGVGGGTFSDWWAYKFEVNDAIPYNAAIMHNQGVTVAINSDDAEMIRRLNQEAAKTMKYGDLSEEEAWKMVTINPAKLLHLDQRTGSIKEGKDADLVLWSHHPLSIYAKAEKTIIDGAIFFDIEKDALLRKSVKEERNKLINQMLIVKQGGAKTQKPEEDKKELMHCDTGA
ncbi:MAG: amidohydrolase [Pseudozobellia sp.]|nr:amidohydrolase [Pseudozobellia sp.]